MVAALAGLLAGSSIVWVVDRPADGPGVSAPPPASGASAPSSGPGPTTGEPEPSPMQPDRCAPEPIGVVVEVPESEESRIRAAIGERTDRPVEVVGQSFCDQADGSASPTSTEGAHVRFLVVGPFDELGQAAELVRALDERFDGRMRIVTRVAVRSTTTTTTPLGPDRWSWGFWPSVHRSRDARGAGSAGSREPSGEGMSGHSSARHGSHDAAPHDEHSATTTPSGAADPGGAREQEGEP